MSQQQIPKFNTYDCIVLCIAEQLRQLRQMPDGTNLLNFVKQVFPRDFWENFYSLPLEQKESIEMSDNLFLDLEKKRNKVSAILKLKVIGGRVVEIAKW